MRSPSLPLTAQCYAPYLTHIENTAIGRREWVPRFSTWRLEFEYKPINPWPTDIDQGVYAAFYVDGDQTEELWELAVLGFLRREFYNARIMRRWEKANNRRR